MKKNASIKLPFLRTATTRFKNLLYDTKVRLFSKRTVRTPKGLTAQKKNDLVFYISFFTFPFILFLLNVVVINGNAFLLAFRSFNTDTGSFFWAGIDNFANVLTDFAQKPMLQEALMRSVKTYLVLVLFTTLVPILFSFYIYKQLPGYKIFKVIIFIPSIISSIITVIIFRIITERMVPEILLSSLGIENSGLLSTPATAFNTVLFYSMWMSFGGGLLIQLAAMNTVDISVTESAELDGIGFFQELWYIVLPASYQVISVGFIAGFASLFTNDLGLFAFYGMGADAKVITLGYYFVISTMQASHQQYPYYAAWGMLTSVIAIPVTLLLRHIIYKYGPSED